MSITLINLPLDILKLLSKKYFKEWIFILTHVSKKLHNLIRDCDKETLLMMLFMKFRALDNLLEELINWFPFRDKYLIRYGTWYSILKKQDSILWYHYTVVFDHANAFNERKINVNNKDLSHPYRLITANPFTIYIHNLDKYGISCNFWTF